MPGHAPERLPPSDSPGRAPRQARSLIRFTREGDADKINPAQPLAVHKAIPPLLRRAPKMLWIAAFVLSRATERG